MTKKEAKTPAGKLLIELYGSVKKAKEQYAYSWGLTEKGLRFTAWDHTVGQIDLIKKAGGKFTGDSWEVTFQP